MSNTQRTALGTPRDWRRRFGAYIVGGILPFLTTASVAMLGSVYAALASVWSLSIWTLCVGPFGLALLVAGVWVIGKTRRPR